MRNGIIEKIVAEKMGFEYDQYNTSSAVGAIISPEDFARYIDVIKIINMAGNIASHTYSSSLEGIDIYLSIYNIDDDLIDDITGSEVKQTELYLAIRKLGDFPRDRIDVDEFLGYVGGTTTPVGVIQGITTATINAERDMMMPTEITIDMVREQAVVPADIVEEIKYTLFERLLEILNTYGSEDNIIYDSSRSLSINNLKRLSDRTGKIIIDINETTDALVRYITGKGISKKELKDNVIIINSNYGFNDNAIIFGHNAPYSMYVRGGDKIFKDLVSNVVIASLNDGTLSIHVRGMDTYIDIVLSRWDGIDYDVQLKEDVELANKYNENLTKDVTGVVVKNSNSRISDLEYTHGQSIKNIADIQSRLVVAMREDRETKELLDIYNSGGMVAETSKRANSDMKALIGLNQIRSIFLDSSTLVVNTNEINVIDDRSKKYHNIGTFKIKIQLTGSESIRIMNTKYNIVAYGGKTMQAPHVFDNGTLCQGNIASAVSNYHANMEIYNLVYSLIMFLESANTNDPAGEFISSWPEVSEYEMEEMDKIAKEDKKIAIDIGEPDEDEIDFVSSIKIERK